VALAEGPGISSDIVARISIDECQCRESKSENQLPSQDGDNSRDLGGDIDESDCGSPDLKADDSWRSDQDTLSFFLADRFAGTPQPPGSIWILRPLPVHIFHCLRQDARERAPPNRYKI
jgi:hypothetical protein